MACFVLTHPDGHILVGGGMGKKILAIASGGGHWFEMCRILPAFEGLDVAFVSVDARYGEQVRPARFYVIRDVSRLQRSSFFVVIGQLARIILRERPDVVITTGSGPALLCLAMAKIFARSKTIWIDSIANVEQLSLSGSMAKYVADVWLTQWEALSRPRGPAYWGSVL